MALSLSTLPCSSVHSSKSRPNATKLLAAFITGTPRPAAVGLSCSVLAKGAHHASTRLVSHRRPKNATTCSCGRSCRRSFGPAAAGRHSTSCCARLGSRASIRRRGPKVWPKFKNKPRFSWTLPATSAWRRRPTGPTRLWAATVLWIWAWTARTAREDFRRTARSQLRHKTARFVHESMFFGRVRCAPSTPHEAPSLRPTTASFRALEALHTWKDLVL